MLEHLPITVIGPGALLTLVVLLILTGKLIPRRTYDDMRDDRDHWRTAQALSEAARLEAAGQVKELLEHARTTDAFIRSIGQAAGIEHPPPREAGHE